ncbi:glycoside hydrolase family 95 protein [Zobellia galactanivorans]|uniref:glycoside hydrolase family 95 protein n=1 Tax=Zobellia galactanivorans (strain DSM 12802 / CCUG 47099 / CIP 106680 / NCIMB 13871 / Dsij) TaxID=63186 RepID=UPI001C07C24A|nr:glycoside hydrolase family 95 protein [Zobellia galactanivorans]MBU3024194.1 glycoside hydrolase family 95 protein [Zobellia galactanivorans]
MMTKKTIHILGGLLLLISFSAWSQEKEVVQNKALTLWYTSPAKKWTDAFPLGNGRLAAMTFGGVAQERFQLNEESLWAGVPSNPFAEDYRAKLTKLQKLILEGKTLEANAFGLENMTAAPASFRSYEPLGDIVLDFKDTTHISNYKRVLDLETGISKVTYRTEDSEMVRESFISAEDDALFIRLSAKGSKKINCTISLARPKDVRITATPEGKLYMLGQIVDIEAPEAHDENAGGSGEGGEHMSFAAGLQTKVSGGKLCHTEHNLVIENADEVLIAYTAATNYDLSKLNFDASVDPSLKVRGILEKLDQKSWKELEYTHREEHRNMFDRVQFDLGTSPNDSLPTDERLLAFKNGAKDTGLPVQLFQFGRYLLMGSSRGPAVLPANLQGKWSERMWAPWEADYHLNVNLQMNYWPADVTNISETIDPLVNWFELIVETSKPLAKEMYGSDGWFSHHASNPFGRVTPSASTLPSQFNNAVLDPLPGAWMAMNLWDHYEFTQDKVFLKERLYPLLKGASEFILDVLVEDSEGVLHFVPSTSPENQYKDPATGQMMRITSTSTYHLSIIRAMFKATLEAATILGEGNNERCKRIVEAGKALPDFPIDKTNGRMMEWRQPLEEKEPGHRHLSHLLGLHPFSLIDEETPGLFEAVRKSLEWREVNGQGGMGWAYAHGLLIHARLKEGEKAYKNLFTLLSRGRKSSLMNTIGPFQIDGNLGATAGISEMLLQSHRKDAQGDFILDLLPAIPSEWSTGNISGLKARGGFELAMKWKENELTVEVSSEKGGSCVVKANNRLEKVKLKAGEKRRLVF